MKNRLLGLAYDASDLLPSEDDAAEAQRMYEALILERGEAAAAEVGAEVVLNIHQGNIADMIHTRAANMVKHVDETTRAALADTLESLTREGASFDDIMRAVRQVFSDRRANAATIARTETAWAYNLASKEAWTEAGVEYVSWLTVGDDAVRDSCAESEAAGVLKMGEMFPNGCQYPGDPNGGPDKTINCRCVLQPETEAPATVGDLASMFSPHTNGDRRAHERNGAGSLAGIFS